MQPEGWGFEPPPLHQNKKLKVKPGSFSRLFMFVMRLDKFLKESGIIRRRTLAQEMIEKGLVLLNERKAKPSSLVREGDRLRLFFPWKVKIFEIKSLKGERGIEVLELKE